MVIVRYVEGDIEVNLARYLRKHLKEAIEHAEDEIRIGRMRKQGSVVVRERGAVWSQRVAGGRLEIVEDKEPSDAKTK